MKTARDALLASNEKFFIQYVSLILIIISVVVGTLYKPENFKKSQPLLVQVPPKEFAHLSFDNIFEDGRVAIRQESMQGLLLALKNHDLDLEALVSVGNEVVRIGQSKQDLATVRSIELTRFFISQGIPVESMKIYSVDSLEDDVQLLIRLSPEDRDENRV